MSFIKQEHSPRRLSPQTSPEEENLRSSFQVIFKQEEIGNIEINQLVNDGLTIAATLLDDQNQHSNPQPHFLVTLTELTKKPHVSLFTEEAFKVTQAYQQGLTGDVDPKKNRPVGIETKKVSRVLEKVIPQENLFHISFAQTITRDLLGSNYPVGNQWKTLNRYFAHARLSDELLTFLYLIKLDGVAYLQMKNWVTSFFKPGTRIFLRENGEKTENKEVNFWMRRLVGEVFEPDAEGIMFCQGYRNRLSPHIERLSQELYEEQAEKAIILWNAVLFIHTEKYLGGNLGVVMVQLVEDLANGKFDDALNIFDRFIKDQPGLFSQKIINDLKKLIPQIQNGNNLTIDETNPNQPLLETYDEKLVFQKVQQRNRDTSLEMTEEAKKLHLNKAYLLTEQHDTDKGNEKIKKIIFVVGESYVHKQVREIDNNGAITSTGRDFRVIKYRIFYLQQDNRIIYRDNGSKYPGVLIRELANEVPNVVARPLPGVDLAFLSSATLYWNEELQRYELTN